MKNKVKNVLLFVLTYLVLCPALLMIIYVLLGNEPNRMTLNRAIASGMGIVTGRFIIQGIEAIWEHIHKSKQ